MDYNEPEWAKYITEESIDNEELQTLISLIGFEATKKIMLHYAGRDFFIPKTVLMKYKHQYILDNYDRTKLSRLKLVRACGITEGYIFKIIKKYNGKNAL